MDESITADGTLKAEILPAASNTQALSRTHPHPPEADASNPSSDDDAAILDISDDPATSIDVNTPDDSTNEQYSAIDYSTMSIPELRDLALKGDTKAENILVKREGEDARHSAPRPEDIDIIA